MSTSLPAKIDLDFVQVDVFEKHAYLVIKEGTILDLPEINQLLEVFNKYYPKEDFGYISDRQFDFSVNPTCYKEVTKHPRLKSIAVLCHKQSTFESANFEKTFYDRPFEAFFSREECENWVSSHL